MLKNLINKIIRSTNNRNKLGYIILTLSVVTIENDFEFKNNDMQSFNTYEIDLSKKYQKFELRDNGNGLSNSLKDNYKKDNLN